MLLIYLKESEHKKDYGVKGKSLPVKRTLNSRKVFV